MSEQCNEAIASFKELLNKQCLKESDLSILLECVTDTERAEYRCKEIIAKDWNHELTDLSSIVTCLKNFKLIIRAVDTNYYRNEMRYPVISTSLLTSKKLSTYQSSRRTVSLVYSMDPNCLVAMSTRDSTTCFSKQRILELPLCSGIFSITSTFGCNDYLKLFNQYYDECLEVLKENPSEYGEILFSSEIEPKAVLLHESVSNSDEVWGRGYAAVYNLPVFKIVWLEDHEPAIKRA